MLKVVALLGCHGFGVFDKAVSLTADAHTLPWKGRGLRDYRHTLRRNQERVTRPPFPLLFRTFRVFRGSTSSVFLPAKSPRHFQPMPIHDQWIRKHPFRRTISLNLARFQHEDSAAKIDHKIQVVRRHNQCPREFAQDV
jgi:hypothetical protein